VRNLSDGRSLEVVAQGLQADLDKFIDLLRAGPPGAVVEKVRIENIESDTCYRDFLIK
jgi:acylphosphatase